MIDVSVMQRAPADPAAPPRERGGILAWLVICFLLVSALLAMGGLFFVHSIKVRQAGNDVQVETPFGSVHVQHGGNGQPVGIPLYPGAKPRGRGENGSVDLSEIFGDKDLHIVAGKWETSDPIDKVEKYYEDKFPDMSVMQHPDKVEMHSVNQRGKKVVVLRSISRDGGSGTEISLASVGEPRAN